MSKTLYVRYRGDGFWAYDVAVGVFLKHLIDSAMAHANKEDALWLMPCVEQWRVNAIVSDLGLHLDEEWSDAQRQTVYGLIEEACNQLEARHSIPWDAMKDWDILDGQGVRSRGSTQFPTAPVVELAHAVKALLSIASGDLISFSSWRFKEDQLASLTGTLCARRLILRYNWR